MKIAEGDRQEVACLVTPGLWRQKNYGLVEALKRRLRRAAGIIGDDFLLTARTPEFSAARYAQRDRLRRSLNAGHGADCRIVEDGFSPLIIPRRRHTTRRRENMTRTLKQRLDRFFPAMARCRRQEKWSSSGRPTRQMMRSAATSKKFGDLRRNYADRSTF